MGKKAPKAPDPYKTAEAQAQFDQQTAQKNAQLSHVNQSNPYGELTWSQTGTNPDGTPIYKQTQSFSAPLQQQFDVQNKNNLSNLNAQSDLYSQLAGRGAFAPSSAGNVNYGLSQDQLNAYNSGLKIWLVSGIFEMAQLFNLKFWLYL